MFINFTHTVSNASKEEMMQRIHVWRMHLRADKSPEELSTVFNPLISDAITISKISMGLKHIHFLNT
jgi:hypothetical protein